MKMQKFVLITSLLTLSFATTAFANEVDDRISNLNDRITDLSSRGCFTSEQTYRLNAKLDSIRSYVERSRSQGLKPKGTNRQLDALEDRIDRITNRSGSDQCH